MSDQEGQAPKPFKPGAEAAPVSRAKTARSRDNIDKGGASTIHRRLIRWAFHLWFRLSRGMTLGVRALVLDENRCVFLVRHSYLPGWHLPGGGVELGQDVRDALEAELREEGNILLTGEPVLFGVYRNHPLAPRDHILVYVVREFRQVAPRGPDHEIVETGFFPIECLPEGTTSATRQRIAEVTCNTSQDRRW